MLDAYTVRARLAPSLLAVFPAVIALTSSVSSTSSAIRTSLSFLGGASVVACILARDRGRRVQKRLWEQWGGSPTLRRLAWIEGDPVETERLHNRVSRIVGFPLPTADEEEADAATAHRRYEEAISNLRELTRDKTRFRLVFAENVDYGYRRNALGLQPIGLLVAGLALGATFASALQDGLVTEDFARWAPAGFVSLLALGFWYRVVTPEWVRLAAENYADRLMDAVFTLSRET